MEKRLPFPGHKVVLRPAGAAVLAQHAGHGGGSSSITDAAPEGEIFELDVDGLVLTLHHLEPEVWHSHSFPFVMFKSAEDVAAAFVKRVEAGMTQPVPQPQPAREVRETAYALRGAFFEFCDCYTVCPCWVDGAPDDGGCAGVFAWAIEQGTIDGSEVSGLRVVSVSTHVGHRDGSQQRVMVFIDDNASERQQEVLTGAFSGAYGGPLGELWSLLGTLLGVERARIAIDGGEYGVRLDVGTRLQAEGVTSIGGNGHETALVNGRLATVLGPRAAVGVARRLRIALADRGIDVDVVGRSAMRGRFDYRNQP